MPLEDRHGFGLYYHDCRFINGYQLGLENKNLTLLAAKRIPGSAVIFELINPEVKLQAGNPLHAGDVCLTWQCHLDGNKNVIIDKIQVKNYSDQ